MGRRAKTPKGTANATRPSAKVLDLERRLADALEERNALSEILQVISRSPSDAQPVFDAIVASATRLLKSYSTGLTQVAGDRLQLAAFTNTDPTGDAFMRAHFPLSVGSDDIHCQAVRDRAPVFVTDVETDLQLSDSSRAYGRARGWRSAVVVPMLRHGEALGSLGVSRREVGGFTADEIALLQAFANQAVIAIENARLFTELQEKNQALTQSHAQVTEALDQQTATSDILRVISSSQTDVQPVFNTIAQSSVRLCEGVRTLVCTFDGALIHLAAYHNATPEALETARTDLFPLPPRYELPFARAILNRAVVHVPDVERESDTPPAFLRQARVRSALCVPLLRDGQAIGVIAVSRSEPTPFSAAQIALLQTFADQAVIAIENVRLFSELQTSNRELTTALDKQTATSDVLRVISRSQTDVQPVFDAILGSAVRLLQGYAGVVTRIAGDQIELAALTSADDVADAAVRARFPRSLQTEGLHAQVIRDRAPLNIADALTDPRLSEAWRVDAQVRGFRSGAMVPILRRDEAVGTLGVFGREPGGFSDDEIALLQTFADQAVIAIENARLLTELHARTRDLEVASQHKSEFLASMSHELRTPLNAIIGFSDVLLQGMFGETNEKQTEYIRDILASGQHLLSLINDILDLSKIEAGGMELDVAGFDLPTAIDDALLLMRERASRRGITLERHVDERLGEIRADQRKVKQVLLNLLSNAVKFTPEGGRIDVRAAIADGTAEISVTDTGIGIAPEDHDAVFEEFRQVGTTDKKAEGTGLGLALCRKFVELHGGRIWVKSRIGEGATFAFTVPLSR
jgi:signal transduction histidine kinase/putative methionine-R-sulfoxide reductase with GAF domain